MVAKKSCRHTNNLSDRRLAAHPLVAPKDGAPLLCTTCLRWFDRKAYTQHARNNQHLICWMAKEQRLFCSSCEEAIDPEELPQKTRDAVVGFITSLKAKLDGAPDEGEITTIVEKKSIAKEEESTEMNEKSLSRPPGLHNLGNTCFMNSALQSLASLSSALPSSTERHAGPLSEAFFDLLSAMHEPVTTLRKSSTRSGSINPSRFFDALSKKYDFFERNEQQDSHDFLHLLFNALDDECGERVPRWHTKTFGGLSVQRVECRKCHNATLTKEACLGISLSLQRRSSPSEDDLESAVSRMTMRDEPIRLVELLEAWSKVQLLEKENAFACENCFKKLSHPDPEDPLVDVKKKIVYSPAYCQLFLKELPQVLMIHLQRFSVSRMSSRKKRTYFGYGKDHQPVSVSASLNVSSVCDPGAEENCDYKLRAMIIHEGSTASSGHYIAVVRRGDSWYRISDSSVSPISETSALSLTDAYVIFYERTTIEQ